MYHKDIMIQGIAEQFKGILRLQGKKTLMVPENRNLQKIHNPSSPLTLSVFLSFFTFCHQFPLLPNLHGDLTHHIVVSTISTTKVVLEVWSSLSQISQGPSVSKTGGSHHGVIATWANIRKAVDC